jgi:hypothetical protein
MRELTLKGLVRVSALAHSHYTSSSPSLEKPLRASSVESRSATEETMVIKAIGGIPKLLVRNWVVC